MGTLNQHVAPHGQCVLSPKGYNAEDISQQFPMSPSLHRSFSFKASQSTPLTKSKKIAANGISVQGEPFYKNSNIENRRNNGMLMPTEDTNAQTLISNGTVLKPMTLRFLRPLMENEKFKLIKEKFKLIKDIVKEPDLFCLDPTEALLVVVSSAVKLKSEQMNQIAVKMQKVTGFRDIKLENNIDPSLIAGFVIAYENKGPCVIDLSVKGKLAELVAQSEPGDQSSVIRDEKLRFLHREI